jgi:DNA-binding winged helix-turn-helix (wHTH) protein
VKATFGTFEFDSERRVLTRDGAAIHLPPKAFRLLEVLLSAAPRALSKDDLTNAVWGDAVMDESNLAGLAGDLRRALDDDPRDPRYLRTVHGFGYAFCGDVAGIAPRVKAASLVFGGQELPLFRGENILGRDPTTDVQVDHVTVSRRHARVFVDADGITVEDLGSKNGTFLDDARLNEKQRVVHGQTITLGDAKLVLRTSKNLSSTVTMSR